TGVQTCALPISLSISGRRYREWELGTYRSAWRVVRGGAILCGSQDVANSIADLDRTLGAIALGVLIDLRQITPFDVGLEFSDGASVEFLSATADEDESFHIFCPGDNYISFSARDGWKVGRASAPWPAAEEPR